MSSPEAPCPVCKLADSMVKHCPSPTCDWWGCRNRSCEAVIDFGRKLGHSNDPTAKGKRRTLTFLPGGEVA